MPRTVILTFIASIAICLTGAAALAVWVLRFRSKERDLLWIGLFAILYGSDLVLRNPIFQLGFGSTHEMVLFAPRLLNACSIVPALLLFEEYYGRGWHSLLHGLTVGYALIAAGVYGYMMARGLPELIPSAATILIICVPLVLAIGRAFHYQPPLLENAKVLFTGLLCFFLAFSIDHLRNVKADHWSLGLEPYGFMVLLFCLGVVATRRVLADERQLAALTDEIHAAAAIQASILPRSAPVLARARIAVRYIPAMEVAGDFYDFPSASPDCVDILLADVMGHGVPAALVASMVKVAVHARSGEAGHPARIIESLNSILCDEAPGQYVTAAYLHLDLSAMSGSYSVAGHPPPLRWSHAGQQLIPLRGGGLLLGVRKRESYGSVQFPLEPGDRILVYTDGLTEAENASGEEFGDRILPAFIAQHQTMSADAFAQNLQEEVLTWSRETMGERDDITFIVIDILPSE